MNEWLPVLLSFYPALNSRVPTVVYGSQILAVTQGLDVSSKDIDLLSPSVTLSAVEEAYIRASGKEEMRVELIRGKKGHVITVYYPTDDRPIPIEIFTITLLGNPFHVFPEHILEVERWGQRFFSLSVEAYLILEVARGIRPVTIERFRRAKVNWEEAESLAKKLELMKKLDELKKEIENK
ncbi:MAG: hypothetical protein ACP5HX_08030 [Thermoproteota archaeon]|jgi:hypothetical protein